MTLQRWLMLAAGVVALLAGLTTMPQRARADEPQYAIFILTEVGWLRYVSPKGYIAQPRSRMVCEIDKASVANLRQGYTLECRAVR